MFVHTCLHTAAAFRIPSIDGNKRYIPTYGLPGPIPDHRLRVAGWKSSKCDFGPSFLSGATRKCNSLRSALRGLNVVPIPYNPNTTEKFLTPSLAACLLIYLVMSGVPSTVACLEISRYASCSREFTRQGKELVRAYHNSVDQNLVSHSRRPESIASTHCFVVQSTRSNAIGSVVLI